VRKVKVNPMKSSVYWPMIRYELSKIVGEKNILDSDVDLDASCTDTWWVSRRWIAKGLGIPKADVIVFPQKAEEVSRIIRLAREFNLPIIPRGGGGGDIGGSVPLNGGIIVDMKKMDRIIEIDESSLTVTVEPGILQIHLEEWLNRRGYTTNHLPASLTCAAVGGLLSTSGSGVLSSKYGKINDMVINIQAVLPTGEIVESLPVHRHSMGPDFSRLFLGAEGTLGIITRVTLNVHPLPEIRRFGTFLFPDLPTAIEAGRLIMVKDLKPCVVRLYDESDTKAVLKNILGIESEGNYMIVGFDGFREVVEAEKKVAFKILNEFASKNLGEKIGQYWWDHRYDSYYPPHALEGTDFVHCVVDVISRYDKILPIYYGMKHVVEEQYKAWDPTFQAHFSHWYDWGISIYPTFVLHNPPPTFEEQVNLFNEVWEKCAEVVFQQGGVLNEHHGVGIRTGWLLEKQEPRNFQLFSAIKKTFDPDHIMNPGKMGLGGLR
jgi:alkyldihydroxyacetonephosphate synthase